MTKNASFEKLNITDTFYSRVMKRFFDFTLSLIAIIVLSPILLLTYLLTVIFLGFPGIYKQARPGRNHKIFHIYKFRSMSNAKKDGVLLPDKDRITWFGKFLRKSSLDELPQLFNILKGDMSIVGPRPRLVKDMVFYDRDVYDYYIVRPGLTGPTQAYGRNRNTWEQVFEKDIAYTHNITLFNDIKIIIRTFTSVFTDKGESHSNSEENKGETSKEQEYYYGDYLERIQKITKYQHSLGDLIARRIIEGSGYIGYYPELHHDFNGLIFTDLDIIDSDPLTPNTSADSAEDAVQNTNADTDEDVPADTNADTDENTVADTSEKTDEVLKADTETDTNMDSDTTQTNTVANPNAEADINNNAITNTVAKPNAGIKTDANPGTETNTDMDADSETDTVANDGTNSNPKTDIE